MIKPIKIHTIIYHIMIDVGEYGDVLRLGKRQVQQKFCAFGG